MSVICCHNSGFFSCCSIKLSEIINYINSNKRIPDHVDSSEQFEWYKPNKNVDITYDYFEHYDKLPDLIHTSDIDYHWMYQLNSYSTLQYNSIVPIIQKYLVELKSVCDKYINQYKWCNEYSPFMVTEGFNIQHYKPNEGYFAWHTERGSSHIPYCNRHLVWMTYLNDVTDGGETEFYYQNIKTKPQKGLTVIFPADWTHTHRGITSKTQNKYIITGWYNFINKGN